MGTGSEPSRMPNPRKNAAGSVPVPFFHAGVTPGPVEIHYVRIEEEARLKTRLGYYRRAIRAREPDQIDETTWLNSYRVIPQTDSMLSIDLLITQVDPPKDKTRDAVKDRDAKEPEKLIIEILAIRIEG